VAARGDVVPPLVRLAPQHRLLVVAQLRRDVGLDADHRLDARAGGLPEEVVGAVHVAVVGDGDRRHAQLADLLEHLLEPSGTVEHGVFGVHMQMDERVAGRHGAAPPV
jgi:hypothetical protein